MVELIVPEHPLAGPELPIQDPLSKPSNIYQSVYANLQAVCLE